MTPAPSVLVAGELVARSTGTRVDYRVLAPRERRPGERLPLILHLHGAMSTAASLEDAKPAYDAAWETGELPRAVVACASTPTAGGFYIDHAGGARWEALVSDELPEIVAAQLPLSDARAALGFSMGGYGALKIALREPERYVAVAALCPVVFPGETPGAVPEASRPAILGELHRAMGEDDATYASNSVYGVLRSRRERIQRAGVAIYVDCGDRDEFGLLDGARYLDGVMSELGIDHRFVVVPGAGHAGDSAAPRRAAAIRFLGAALRGGRGS